MLTTSRRSSQRSKGMTTSDPDRHESAVVREDPRLSATSSGKGVAGRPAEFAHQSGPSVASPALVPAAYDQSANVCPTVQHGHGMAAGGRVDFPSARLDSRA